MTQKSNFHHDLNQEQILGEFLDKFYDIHFPQEMTRVTDDVQQMAGIDLIFDRKIEGDCHYSYIDEKAQLSYINKPLETFIFELSYLLNNRRNKGWLFDKQKMTQAYFLITKIFTKDKDPKVNYFKEKSIKLKSEDQVQSCVLTKVHRKTFISYLENTIVTNPKSVEYLNKYKGMYLTEENCEEISEIFKKHIDEDIKNNTDNQKYFGIFKLELDEVVKICYSPDLNEQPLSLIINLEDLSEEMNATKKDSVQSKCFDIDDIK